jgi:hypothetical protein
MHVVLRRNEGPHNAGWVVGHKETDTTRAEVAELMKGFPYRWEVETIIEDANWDGPVWVGGAVGRADPKDGRPMFKCS